MLGPEVLDSDRFSEIRFEANKVEQTRQDRFLVSGSLSLHDRTRPICACPAFQRALPRDAVLKQRDFGITPVSVAGGTVRVKDTLKIEFEIATEAGPTGQIATGKSFSVEHGRDILPASCPTGTRARYA